MRITWRARKRDAHLGIEVGDLIEVDTGQPAPAIKVTEIPLNFGAFLGAEVDGTLERLTCRLSVSDRRRRRRTRPSGPIPARALSVLK